MELTPTVDLRACDVPVGGALRADGPVELAPLTLAGQAYTYRPSDPDLRLDLVRAQRSSWHMRLRGECTVLGPCWVCLGDAEVPVAIDATEMHDPASEDPELESLYVEDGVLDVADWGRDAIAEALPTRLVCREDCKGICPSCGIDRNAGSCECATDAPDPRWGPLADLGRRLADGEGGE